MYILKDEMKPKIIDLTNRAIAHKVGISESYMSEILNGHKKNISKTLAYAISKALCNYYEIEDVFKIV